MSPNTQASATVFNTKHCLHQARYMGLGFLVTIILLESLPGAALGISESRVLR